MNKYDKEVLDKLINKENKSYSFIGKLYGVTGNMIKKMAIKMGVKIPKRRNVSVKENFSHPRFKKNTLVNKISDDEFINIIKTSKMWKDMAIKFGYKNPVLSPNVKNAIIERCNKLGLVIEFDKECNFVGKKTKGELFNERCSWSSARSAIRKNAYRNYIDANPNPKCVICGYDKHVEVAHIKAVSKFDNQSNWFMP